MQTISETPPPQAALASRNRWPWFFLKLLLALGLFGVVLSKLRLEEVHRVWQQMSWGWLPWYFLFFGGNVLVVAWRYHTLLLGQVPFLYVLSIVLLQTSLGNLVFNVAGSTIYVAMMRGKYEVGIGRGISTLVAARLLDVWLWLPLFAVATWRVWPQVAEVSWLPMSVLGSLSMAMLVIVLAVIWRHQFLFVLSRILEFLGLSRWAIVQKGMLALTVLAEEQPQGWRSQAVPLLSSSILLVVGSLGAYYCNLCTFGLILPFWPLIFIYFFVTLPTFFPIVVFGGLGVSDISGLFLFSLFGLGPYTMAPVILGARLLFYVANLLLVLCYLTGSYWPGSGEKKGNFHA